MPKKHLLIATLIALDILLVTDIIHKKNPNISLMSYAHEKIFSITSGQVAGVSIQTNKPTIKKTDIPGIPSISVHPSNTPSPTLTPFPTPTTTDILVYPSQITDLLQQINSFRSGKGLAPLSANSETCFFANLRSQEIITNFNHDGFRNRIDTKTLPYPSYSSVAENISYNGDSSQVVPNWINSGGHAENLLKDVPYGCVGNSGIHYVFEAWQP
ncbi:MAG: CAP domain-containing protein [Candidatus Levybacteria bacterium]|nr:CAP domain-containing protein [Candidatus Levybacteria bacterium]